MSVEQLATELYVGIGILTGMIMVTLIFAVRTYFKADDLREENQTLEDKLTKFKEQLKLLDDYLEAKDFVSRFKWGDIKNKKLREETKLRDIFGRAETRWEFPIIRYASYSDVIDNGRSIDKEQYITMVEELKKVLLKDKEIECYTKKEKKDVIDNK